MKTYQELQDKEWLQAHYLDKGLEIPDIANQLGCSKPAVRLALKRHNILIRSRVFKFPQLNNKEWLQEHYTNQGLSTKEIADQLGCTKHGVRVALKRHSIELRSAKESNSILHERDGWKSSFPQLNNEEWLRRKFIDEELAPLQIARLVGAKEGATVDRMLRYFGIPRKPITRAFTSLDDNFTLDRSVVDGCLLGDGFLRVWNPMSTKSFPAFAKRNKYYDHVEYVARALCGDMAESRIKLEKMKSFGKIRKSFLFSTITHEELKSFHQRWYPSSNGFVKLIPDDIIIDEKVLLHWFLDDGSTSYRVRGGKLKTKQIRMTFCTECFTKEDQQVLADKVNAAYNLSMRIRPYIECWRLHIPQSKVSQFYEIVGPPPIQSLAYKWK